MKIDEIMTKSVVTVTPETPYKDVVELLVTSDVSGLPVVDGSGALVGIVTEADLVSKPAYGGHRHRALALVVDVLSGREHHWVTKGLGTVAADVMTAAPLVCSPDDDVRVVARNLLGRGVKRVPVVREGHLVGIVSRHDILKSFVRDDVAIAAEVAHVLATDPNRLDDCHVTSSVTNGVVTLTGQVRYAWDVPIVASMVRNIAGVIDVENHVQNREPNPVPPPSPWLHVPR